MFTANLVNMLLRRWW